VLGLPARSARAFMPTRIVGSMSPRRPDPVRLCDSCAGRLCSSDTCFRVKRQEYPRGNSPVGEWGLRSKRSGVRADTKAVNVRFLPLLTLCSRPCFESSLSDPSTVRSGRYNCNETHACRGHRLQRIYTSHGNTRPCSARAFSATAQIANSFSSSRRRQTSCTATGPPTYA
jgi:hypothetical protein